MSSCSFHLVAYFTYSGQELCFLGRTHLHARILSVAAVHEIIFHNNVFKIFLQKVRQLLLSAALAGLILHL